jgi:hypothetical protein
MRSLHTTLVELVTDITEYDHLFLLEYGRWDISFHS